MIYLIIFVPYFLILFGLLGFTALFILACRNEVCYVPTSTKERTLEMSEANENVEVSTPVEFNIHAEVKSVMVASTPAIRDRIVNDFANKELKKLEDAAVKAIGDLDATKSELKKIKPDNTQYNAEGAVVGETYNKDTVEKRKQLLQKISKLEEAIRLALVDNDYSKVLNLK